MLNTLARRPILSRSTTSFTSSNFTELGLFPGTPGDDTLIGTAGSNFLNGKQGNDLLIGNGGSDIVFGHAGDDILAVSDLNFRRIIGGVGIDTLRLDGSRFNLNLSVLPENTITSIEQIDLTGSGNNRLTLSASDVLALSNTTDQLIVNGNAGDKVVALGEWAFNGTTTIDGVQYNQYTHSDATLLVNGAVAFNPPSSELDISELNGDNGFVIEGPPYSGYSVSSAGDINGDGFDDLIIAAPVIYGSGEAYVVFGQAEGFGSSFDLSTLDGTNGFVITSIGMSYYDAFVVSSAGDVNGDGIDDLIVGSGYDGDFDGDGKEDGSTSCVVFGSAEGFSPTLDLFTLDGSNGFRFTDQNYSIGGVSVSYAGDINGDGIDDLILDSYVVFGSAESFEATLDISTLDGSNGFAINGINPNDRLGVSVSYAGDINGDDIDDLMIGVPLADANGQSNTGASYVVFGSAEGFEAALDISTLDGSNGFAINGINPGEKSGYSVSCAGDVNGDGIDDLVIGVPLADANGQSDAGASYVVFGQVGGFSPTLDLSTLDGSNGFVINGINAGERLGISVSSAGDVNGDGIDDLMIGAVAGLTNGQDPPGSCYVVFGQAEGFNSTFDLLTLDGSNGFVINDIYASSWLLGTSNRWVSSAGDVNGDGFDDLMIGAHAALESGASYVVFGGDFTGQVSAAGTQGNDVLIGHTSTDIMIGDLGDDILVGGGGSDVLKGGAGSDTLAVSDLNFRKLEGGSGFDTLSLDGNGFNLNLIAIPNNQISGMEQIDLTGTGNNSLTLSVQDVYALSDTTNQLIVQGNIGDAVTSTEQGWTFDGTTNLDGILYNQYSVGAATLLVSTEITQAIT